jgi:hypothetical protein
MKWADDDRLNSGTQFHEAKDEAEMLEQMRKYCENSDFFVKGYEKLPVGDCWVKWNKEPAPDEIERLSAEAGELIVRPPGTHPGGKQWWIEPVETIYKPVTEERSQLE